MSSCKEPDFISKSFGIKFKRFLKKLGATEFVIDDYDSGFVICKIGHSTFQYCCNEHKAMVQFSDFATEKGLRSNQIEHICESAKFQYSETLRIEKDYLGKDLHISIWSYILDKKYLLEMYKFLTKLLVSYSLVPSYRDDYLKELKDRLIYVDERTKLLETLNEIDGQSK